MQKQRSKLTFENYFKTKITAAYSKQQIRNAKSFTTSQHLTSKRTLPVLFYNTKVLALKTITSSFSWNQKLLLFLNDVIKCEEKLANHKRAFLSGLKRNWLAQTWSLAYLFISAAWVWSRNNQTRQRIDRHARLNRDNKCSITVIYCVLLMEKLLWVSLETVSRCWPRTGPILGSAGFDEHLYTFNLRWTNFNVSLISFFEFVELSKLAHRSSQAWGG